MANKKQKATAYVETKADRMVLGVSIVGLSQNIKNISLDWFGRPIVRIHIKQSRSGRIDPVQDKLVALALGKDQKFAVTECGAVNGVRIVKRPVTNAGCLLPRQELTP